MSKKLAQALSTMIDIATLPLNERQRNKTLGSIANTIERRGLSTVHTPKGDITFFNLRGSGIASAITDFAAGTWEPETMEWVDTYIRPGETVWDIGASIGLCALYAGLNPQVHVMAFEPAHMDFSLLNEHIALNNMSANVMAYCIAMSGETKLDTLYLSNGGTGAGGNAVGAPEVFTRPFEAKFAQAIPAFTVDDFRKAFNLPAPQHIKLDVDGIEGQILRGMKETLPHVQSLLVEVEQANAERAEELIEPPIFAAGLKEVDTSRTKYNRNRLYARI